MALRHRQQDRLKRTGKTSDSVSDSGQVKRHKLDSETKKNVLKYVYKCVPLARVYKVASYCEILDNLSNNDARVTYSVGSSRLALVAHDYTLCHVPGCFTVEMLMDTMPLDMVRRHSKHLINDRSRQDIFNTLESVFYSVQFSSEKKKWMYPEEEVVPTLDENDLGMLDDSFGYSLPREDRALQMTLTTGLLGDMSNSIGRIAVAELLRSIARVVNLAHCTISENVGGGAKGPDSVIFKDYYKDSDLVWIYNDGVMKSIMMQVQVKTGVVLSDINRNQLHEQMVGSLLLQSQVYGLLICSKAAELYFAHRTRASQKLHLFELRRYDLCLLEDLKSLTQDLMNAALIQACSLTLDPLHAKT